MSTKSITFIAIISISLVLLTQAYLVFDYFQTVRYSLTRESDAILKEAFRTDLNQRNTKLTSEAETNSLPTEKAKGEPVNGDAVMLDLTQVGMKDESFLNKMDIMMNLFISSAVPLNIETIDSITGRILKSRNIRSEYVIQLLDPKTDSVMLRSKSLSKISFLVIPSKLYPLDFENKEALRLVLINPFMVIIKRMGLMLLGSVIFSIISLLVLRFLVKVLAKQKQLVTYKNEFLSNIAHELKRPLSSLMVSLDCLQMPEFFENIKMRDTMLTNSMNSVTELNGTISMIVGLARVEEGLLMLNKQSVSLVKILGDLKSRFISSPKKKITINAVYDTEDVVIIADSIMLTQCFANLIDNSIKYSNESVLIDISVADRQNFVELHFKDNGIGIPEDKISRIFDKYSRVDHNVKVNGFGIGLNYVKTIIEKHNGEISVTSVLGDGSDFKIILPKK